MSLPNVSVFAVADGLPGDPAGQTLPCVASESHSMLQPSDLHHELGLAFAIPHAWCQR